MEKILVTGCAGFIGSNLTDSLIAKNYDVIGIDNFNDYYNPSFKRSNIRHLLRNNKFHLLEKNVTNNKLQNTLSILGVDRIIHLAANPGVRKSLQQPLPYYKNNIMALISMLEFAKNNNIKKFIFTSSSSVYGDAKTPFKEDDTNISQLNPYASSKFVCEKICKAYHDMFGIEIINLRFFSVYGPRGRPDMAPYLFMKSIIDNKPIEKFGDGTMGRDWTFVDDINNGIISAMNSKIKYDTINLGNSQPISLNEFIRTIESITQKKATIKHMPKPKADVNTTYANITKAKSLLNYNPSTYLKDGIEKFYQWFIKNKR